MKILILKSGKYPSPEASSKRLSNYCKAFAKGGHEVDIKTVNVKAKSPIFDFVGSYLVPYFAFYKTMSHSNHYSAVLVYGFGWIGKLLIIAACKIKRKQVVLELNELPYSINGGSRRDIILKYFNAINRSILEHFVFGLFDGFIVISDKLLSYVKEYKKRSAPILKVPILVDFTEYQKAKERPLAQFPYFINTARTNNHKDGIINVLQAFSVLINSYKVELSFYLTSNVLPSDLRAEVERIITGENLGERVTFLGDLDEDELLAWQAHSAFLVLNKVDSQQNRYNFATKLGEFLALGKPVITSNVGEVTNYLKHNLSCIYVDPTDYLSIAKAMYRILTEPDLAEEIGEAGKEIAKAHFDYQIQSPHICNFFERINLNRQ